ncbi:hypothetical protein [Brachyspira catarrhinii]|nr:hypothetical protein [Brachyspira catarrhinii]
MKISIIGDLHGKNCYKKIPKIYLPLLLNMLSKNLLIKYFDK